MTFRPRPFLEHLVTSDFHLEEFGDIYMDPIYMQFYHIADIFQYKNKWYMIVMQDFDKGMMRLEDMTGKVTGPV